MRHFAAYISIFFLFLQLEARPLVFAPLPYFSNAKVLEDFLPMVNYLEEALGETIVFHYETRYDQLVTAFKENKIDIAYVGPLPLAQLQKTSSQALPIVTFHEADGQKGYRCVLVKFANDAPMKAPTIALTQPLSTCGYVKTKELVQTAFHQDLDTLRYRYVGSHDEVALSILRGDFHSGGMKESIAKEYASLGIEIIEKTALIPGFTLVANTKTLTPQQITQIQQTLLLTPKERYTTWGKDISHGMSKCDPEALRSLNALLETTYIPERGSF